MTIRDLVGRNQRFAAEFGAGEMGLRPRLDLVVVSCVDPRVDPASYWGLELGDAFVIRTVGGRVTDDVILNLGMIHYLVRAAEQRPVALHVAVVHHTSCGALQLTSAEVRDELGASLGIDASVLERLAAADPRASVQVDVERVRTSTVLPDDLRVSGHVYDLETGSVSEVVAQEPLRS